MVISITIEDSRLSEFSRLYSQFLAGVVRPDGPEEKPPAPAKEDALWSVQDIADYLRITRSNLYGASRHLLPPDSLVVTGGAKNRKWRRSDVLRHLKGLGVKPKTRKRR